MKPLVVNGRDYPMWSQFVEKKDDFIGKTLEDHDSMSTIPLSTTITDVTLEPNGDSSAFFRVVGKDFTCGFDVKYGGIAAGDEGYLTFSGPMGHTWRIKV